MSRSDVDGAACNTSLPAAKRATASDLVALVMPVHPKHFPYGIHFVHSMLLCKQSTSFYRLFPVFSNMQHLHSFKSTMEQKASSWCELREAATRQPEEAAAVAVWTCSKGLQRISALVVEHRCNNPDRVGKYVRDGQCTHGGYADGVVSAKKLGALRQIFGRVARTSPFRFAMTIDSEFEFQSTRSYMRALDGWSAAKQVVAVHLSHCNPTQHYITNMSCAAVGVAPQPYYYWWTTAPIYERTDFDAFYNSLNHSLAESSYLVFEHNSYLCPASQG